MAFTETEDLEEEQEEQTAIRFQQPQLLDHFWCAGRYFTAGADLYGRLCGLHPARTT